MSLLAETPFLKSMLTGTLVVSLKDGEYAVHFALERKEYPIGRLDFDFTPADAAFLYAIHQDLAGVVPISWEGWVPDQVPPLPKLLLALLGTIRFAAKKLLK